MFSLIIELNDAAVIEIINSTIIKVWKLNICVGYSAKNPNFEILRIFLLKNLYPDIIILPLALL